MTKIHLICRNPAHLWAVEEPEYETGYWTLYEAEAEKLIGGNLYLHKKKREHSYFGGRILGYRVGLPTDPNPGGIIFSVLAEAEGKDVVWQGDTHPMAWMSGILEG
jgi:hypothetical protein